MSAAESGEQETHHLNNFLKSKIKSSFTALASDVAVHTQKKTLGKQLDLLRELTFYSLSPDMEGALLTLLSAHELKSARLANYHLMRLYDAAPTMDHKEALATRITTCLESEVALTQLNDNRRIAAMRTLSLIIPPDQVKGVYRDTILYFLAKGFEKKAKKEKRTFRRAEKRDKGKWLLQYAAFTSILHQAPALAHEAEIVNRLPDGLQSEDPLAVRHTLAIGCHLADDPVLVVEVFASALSHSKMGAPCHANLEDTLARVYLMRLCAKIAFRDDGRHVDKHHEFFRELCYGVQDKSDRVFVEACLLLAKGGWEKIADASLDNNQKIVHIICERLVEMLAKSLQPVEHTVARVMAVLAESYATSRTKGDAHVLVPAHPLNALFGHLESLLRSSSRFVRIQALRALIWFSEESRDSAVFHNRLTAELERELRDSAITSELIEELFDTFKRRVATNAALIPPFLAYTEACIQRVPDKLQMDPLMGAWKSLLERTHDARLLVLETLHKILDTPLPLKHRSRVCEIRRAILWFMGEHGNAMANEHMGRYAKKVSEGSPDFAAVIQRLSSPSSNFVCETGNFPIKCIVLRLQHATVFSDYDTRRTAFLGLIKIALRSEDPLRLALYDFFVQIVKEPMLGLQGDARAILHMLDDIYEVREKLLDFTFKGEGQVGDFKAAHKRLVDKASLFCSLPPNYTPLGKESATLVL